MKHTELKGFENVLQYSLDNGIVNTLHFTATDSEKYSIDLIAELWYYIEAINSKDIILYPMHETEYSFFIDYKEGALDDTIKETFQYFNIEELKGRNMIAYGKFYEASLK